MVASITPQRADDHRPIKTARAIATERAESAGYDFLALCGRSQTPDLARLRAGLYVELSEDRGMSDAQIGRLFNRSRVTVNLVRNAEKKRSLKRLGYLNTPDGVDSLAIQVRRLLDYNLPLNVAHRLDIPAGLAVMLSVLMQSYPRARTRCEVAEIYDLGIAQLFGDDRDPSSDETIRTQIHRLKKWASREGLPDPIQTIAPRGYVLTDEMALWLHNQFGRPLCVRL